MQTLNINDVYTTPCLSTHFPTVDFFEGITLDPSSITANQVTNASVKGSNLFPDVVFDYCNVTFTYAHNGRGNQVVLTYWLPTPNTFQNPLVQWLVQNFWPRPPYSACINTRLLIGPVVSQRALYPLV
jgi:hypothetical protein